MSKWSGLTQVSITLGGVIRHSCLLVCVDFNCPHDANSLQLVYSALEHLYKGDLLKLSRMPT